MVELHQACETEELNEKLKQVNIPPYMQDFKLVFNSKARQGCSNYAVFIITLTEGTSSDGGGIVWSDRSPTEENKYWSQVESHVYGAAFARGKSSVMNIFWNANSVSLFQMACGVNLNSNSVAATQDWIDR
jgi:hypothetical protein